MIYLTVGQHSLQRLNLSVFLGECEVLKSPLLSQLVLLDQ